MVRIVLGSRFTADGLQPSTSASEQAMAEVLVALRLKVRRMRSEDFSGGGLISRAAVLRKFDDVIAGLNVDRSPYP